MRRRKLYRGLAVAFSAILLATSNPATLQNVAAKGIHLQKKAKAKMILEDPTENGAYTLSMTINKEGTSEESMLSGFIDPKIKVTVQDGKTWVNILSTTYADMMYDITLGDSEGNYKTSEKTPVGEKILRALIICMSIRFRSINCQTSQKSQYWQNLWEEAETI